MALKDEDAMGDIFEAKADQYSRLKNYQEALNYNHEELGIWKKSDNYAGES